MKRIDHAYQGKENENITENQAEPIHLSEGQLLPHEGYRPMVSLRGQKKKEKTEYRRDQQDGRFGRAPHKKEERRADEEEGTGMNPLNHSSPLISSVRHVRQTWRPR